MIDHSEVVTIVANTCFSDKLIDLRKYHYGSIVVPVTHTGNIGFYVGPTIDTTNGKMAVDNSMYRIQVTVRANSLGHYPLPSYLFDYAAAQLWNQINGTNTVVPANTSFTITLKE